MEELGETLEVPLVAVELLQEVEQLVALVEVQVRVLAWPAVMESGLALRLTVGAGTGTVLLTVTVIVVEVVVSSEVSVAMAVRLWLPLPRVVVSQA
ncbi:MAG: hypothetical protein Q8P98_11395 [Candidatus Rokubacteria bacterium]|nr:hypothetical protein [Candidatus Rokubacteria bacterium]